MPFRFDASKADERLPLKGLGTAMNCYFDHDREAQLLKSSFYGELNGDVLLASTITIRELAARLQPSRAITDFTEVQTINIASHTIESFAHLPPTFPPNVIRVIVAPMNHLFGLARMFQTLGGDSRPNLHVVRSLDEAYRMLGLDKPPVYDRLEVA